MIKYILTTIFIAIAILLDWIFQPFSQMIMGSSTPKFLPFKVYTAGCSGAGPIDLICNPQFYTSGIILSVIFWLIAFFLLIKIEKILFKIISLAVVLFGAYLISMR